MSGLDKGLESAKTPEEVALEKAIKAQEVIDKGVEKIKEFAPEAILKLCPIAAVFAGDDSTAKDTVKKEIAESFGGLTTMKAELEKSQPELEEIVAAGKAASLLLRASKQWCRKSKGSVKYADVSIAGESYLVNEAFLEENKGQPSDTLKGMLLSHPDTKKKESTVVISLD